MVNIWRFFFKFIGNSFELLGHVMDPGAEVLLYLSVFLIFSLFRENLENSKENLRAFLKQANLYLICILVC